MQKLQLGSWRTADGIEADVRHALTGRACMPHEPDGFEDPDKFRLERFIPRASWPCPLETLRRSRLALGGGTSRSAAIVLGGSGSTIEQDHTYVPAGTSPKRGYSLPSCPCCTSSTLRHCWTSGSSVRNCHCTYRRDHIVSESSSHDVKYMLPTFSSKISRGLSLSAQ